MSDVVSPIAHALALATSLYGTWDCKSVGPAFVSQKSVHTDAMMSELIAHDKFVIGLDRLSISESNVSVGLTYRDQKFSAVAGAYFWKGRLVLMVPIEIDPDLRTFTLTASKSGSVVRIEASFPLSISVHNFGGVVGPDKFAGDYAVAAAVYECQAGTAQ